MNRCQFFNQMVMQSLRNPSALLPDAYRQVEYLQSSGTQYINIGAIGNHQFFDIDFERVSWVSNGAASFGLNGLFGINDYMSSGTNDVKVWLRNTNAISGAVGSTAIGSASIVTGTRYTLYFSNTQFKLDGQDYTTATGTAISGTPDCYLFAVHNRTGVATWGSSAVKIYRLKTSSIHLYPCYRKSDNKPGMYDLVSGTFYTNSGSGEFTVGSAV